MKLISILLTSLVLSAVTISAVNVADLPPTEKTRVETVDPWGLAFGDQLTRFESYFKSDTNAPFAVGYTHNLVKIWPNKYWFRGAGVFVSATNQIAEPIFAVTGGSASFQIAVLPKIAAAEADYTVRVESPIAARIYREEFVATGPTVYPRFETDLWPDPLIETNVCRVGDVNAGVFLVDLTIPADFKDDTFTCKVDVTGAGKIVSLSVPIRVVKLAIQPKAFPVIALFGKGPIGEGGYDKSIELILAHHVQPLTGDHLKEMWTKGPDAFQKFVQTCMDHGQKIFQVTMDDPKLYEFLKKQNWLDHFIAQVGSDEPNEETFKRDMPAVEAFRAKYPGIRILLASERWPEMEKGCDIWLTDLSTSTYDPRTFSDFKKPELWHYYCHIPIQAQLRAPLVFSPNMQIDNPALEHRVALWMSWYFKANGVYIWSGNFELPAPDFWKSPQLKLEQAKAGFPYGGVHHGNGFLVYPPKEPGGVIVPSLRLKILRDGLEDIAIFEAIKKRAGGTLPEWCSPVPEVFHHPHYFDHLPETVLTKRATILKRVAAGELR